MTEQDIVRAANLESDLRYPLPKDFKPSVVSNDCGQALLDEIYGSEDEEPIALPPDYLKEDTCDKCEQHTQVLVMHQEMGQAGWIPIIALCKECRS